MSFTREIALATTINVISRSNKRLNQDVLTNKVKSISTELWRKIVDENEEELSSREMWSEWFVGMIGTVERTG